MQYFQRLMSYTRRYTIANALGLLLSMGAVLLGLAVPYLSKAVVDDVLISGNYPQLTNLVSLLLVASFLRALLHYLRLYVFEYTSQKVLYDLRSDLYRKLQGQSFQFYDKVRTGHLMNRMVGDLQSIRGLLNTGFVQLFEGLFAMITTVLVMLALDIRLTLALLLVLPLVLISTRKMAQGLRPVFSQIRAAFEEVTSTTQENITGIRVVKAFGREDFERAKFARVAGEFTKKNIEAAAIRSRFVPMANLISGAGAVIILLFGGYLVIVDQLTVGALVAFNGYMLMLQGPINSVNGLVNQWENALASLEKICELLDEEPAIQNRPDAQTLSPCQGDVEFRNVWFHYGEEAVLKGVNFAMHPGSITAIMGDTGAGKTTIINLLARFYDCTSGQVCIDGTDVRDVNLDNLRRQIGIILQETFLFSDTIAANIAFARPEASQPEIERAARSADAHEFISEMQNGYQTVIGERGMGLSGGQKQRIAIARALLSDPRILILDDATSSVDMETEYEIQQTLKDVMKERTTLIIAHRISSVKDADQILVLAEGSIVEQGTHDELVRQRGRYFRTLIDQYKDYQRDDNQQGVGRS